VTSDLVAGGAVRTGRVETFDDARGIGSVAADDGSSYPFHCTAIADGTRTIAVGTPVAFTLAPGHLGRVEARTVSVLRPA